MSMFVNFDGAAALATAGRARAGKPATEKQVNFGRSLYREIRDLFAARDGASDAEVLASLGRRFADAKDDRKAFSETIDVAIKIRDEAREYARSQRHPNPTPRTSDIAASVPEGRYAIRNDEGVVKFYEVDKPEQGRWAGYTFVSVRASDERHPIRNRESRNAILEAIAEDPQAASSLFGQELGVCGVCGRTLTDETSRAYGIGPVCRENTGW